MADKTSGAGPLASPDAEAGGQAEAGFRAAFEAAFDAMFVLDDAARVVEVNLAAASLLDQPRERLLGQPLPVLLHQCTALVEEAWAHLRREGVVRRALSLRRNGGALEVELAGRAAIAQGRHLVMLRDVTSERQGVRSMNAVRRQLSEQERLVALGMLVSGVAHEVRTPLTFVANNLFILQTKLDAAVRDGELDEAFLDRLRPHMVDALGGVDRINHLVLELRRFTQRKAGARVRLPLHEAVAGAVDLFRVTSRGRATLTVDLASTPEVEMDVGQVQQVILNLLENAFDAVASGGSVHVSTGTADGKAKVVVRDDGAGIPPELHERVFENFFTTKPHGTGLGLSIIHRIVEAHGGSVALDSSPGEGATVTVRFPAASPTAG